MLAVKLILLLVKLALRVGIYVVIASGVLSTLQTYLRPRWIEHPLVQAVIAVGNALCAPARALMEAFGISLRPFDFSPLITVAVLEVALALLGLFSR